MTKTKLNKKIKRLEKTIEKENISLNRIKSFMKLFDINESQTFKGSYRPLFPESRCKCKSSSPYTGGR